MSEVAISVGGRTYRVACAEGEEDRVRRLGATVNAKLEAMGRLGPQDAQNLLFASIMLADDVHEAQEAAAKAEEDKVEAQRSANTATGQHDDLRKTIAGLEAELDRLRNFERSAAGDLEETRGKAAALAQQIADRAAEEDALRTKVAELSEANDALKARFAERPASDSADLGDPALASALEKFAEQLEICADRLEDKPLAS